MKTVLPPIAGIATVLILLVLINIIFFKATALTTPDRGFFSLFVPFTTVSAILIQLLITLPIWEQFKKRSKFIGFHLVPFTILVIIICGLLFGFVFWEPSLGYSELVAVTLTGLGAFAVYWTVNLLVLKKLTT